MKSLLYFIILFLPLAGTAQFYDDFGDNDFTNNPVWTGDTANFEAVSSILHLNAPAVTDTSVLTTFSDTLSNAWWSFTVTMTFNPSSANYARIYLASSNANLKDTLNGYFVMIGNTTDEISLYRQDSSAITEILDGLDGSVGSANVNVRILVTRDGVGSWMLMRDTTGGSNWITEGSVVDNTYTTTSWFGIYCRYTSTRSTKFWFDDIFVSAMPLDTTAPVVDSIVVLNNTQLDLWFNEILDTTTAQQLTAYSADNGIGTATAASSDALDRRLVHLSFGNAFPNGIMNTLNISGVADTSANVFSGSVNFMYFSGDTAMWRDLVINEIMADPSPPVAAAFPEFVELFNRSQSVFDIGGWDLVNTGSSNIMSTMILQPGGYVLLCDISDTAALSLFGPIIGISGFNALTNSGDSLTLKSPDGTVIDITNYDLGWYHDPDKDGGGWSMERINPWDSCLGSDNWHASSSPFGATPGAQNAVFDTTPDLSAPQLVAIQLMSADTLQLTFDEAPENGSVAAASFSSTPTLTPMIMAIAASDPYTVNIVFITPADSGMSYTFTFSGISDCPGNVMGTVNGSFLLPQTGLPGDIIINELLFDPPAGGEDYVELYNNSDKVMDLYNWSLARFYADTIADLRSVASHKIMHPGDFAVLTKDSSFVLNHYPAAVPGTFIEMSSMPSYNNDSSTVFLLNNKNLLCDRFSYSDTMHFPLLDNTEGVSLERLSYDRPTADPGNWHSAASGIGFGTPGGKNSQFTPENTGGGTFTLSANTFSPDNDGLNDVLSINYVLKAPGYVANVSVYDASGRLKRVVAANELCAERGVWTWDGVDEEGQKAQVGIYIIYISLFNTTGDVQEQKLPVTVAGY